MTDEKTVYSLKRGSIVGPHSNLVRHETSKTEDNSIWNGKPHHFKNENPQTPLRVSDLVTFAFNAIPLFDLELS